MLPMDTVKPTTVSASVMPAQVQAQIAKEKEAEAARIRLAADAKQKEAEAEKSRKLAAFNSLTPDKDINLADPYGNAIPDYDTSGHAALAESMEGSGIKNLKGDMTTEAKVQKHQDTIEAGRLPKPAPVNEERIPDSQAAIDVKSPASSASEIANAPPDRVGDVIKKLMEEEKKGGPNFFDVIEAAAAGWNGKIPMYVQKQIAEEEQKDQLEKMQAAAQLDEESYAKELADKERMQKEGFAFDAEQAEADRKNRLELAGLNATAPATVGKLSLGGLSAFGGK